MTGGKVRGDGLKEGNGVGQVGRCRGLEASDTRGKIFDKVVTG